MNNKIQQEQKLSEKYLLTTIKVKERELVKLTQDNVARVEAMIANDSDYLKEMQIKEPDGKKYEGSNAYWIMELIKLLNARGKINRSEYERIVKEVVNAIDRSNSTHLNADGSGREEIAARIYGIGRAKLKKYLKDPDETNLKLITIISNKTTGKDKKGRKNLSFASKFCQEVCFHLFQKTKYQDNYSKYDAVVRKCIPLYAEYYGIECEKGKLEGNYEYYRTMIDSIIKKSGNKISRNGFDHLLWYYFKGRL